MIWSRNEQWMLTGDDKGYVKYWQANMNNVKMFQGHLDAIRGLRYYYYYSYDYIKILLFILIIGCMTTTTTTTSTSITKSSNFSSSFLLSI